MNWNAENQLKVIYRSSDTTYDQGPKEQWLMEIPERDGSVTKQL